MSEQRLYNRNRICDFCKKGFIGYPGKPKGKKTYCGLDCRNSAMAKRNQTTQRVNKKGGLTEEEKEKIRKSRLGTGDGQGYKKIFGQHEHRNIMEVHLGRKLKSDEIVHHVNGDKHDNRLANLQVMTQSEHIRLHLEEGGGSLHASKTT